jgi:hypothetical protein
VVIKEETDEIGETYSTHFNMEDSIQYFSRNDLKDGYVLNVDVHGKIILKWVLNTT